MGRMRSRQTSVTVDNLTILLTAIAEKVGVDQQQLEGLSIVVSDGQVTALPISARKSKGQRRAETWMTRAEVQEVLRVSRATVERMFKSGRLPASKVGRQWRIRRSDVDAFLNRQRPKGRMK